MGNNQSRPEWVQKIESDLQDAVEELSRIDDQGRKDYTLQNKVNQLRSALDAANSIFTETCNGCE